MKKIIISIAFIFLIKILNAQVDSSLYNIIYKKVQYYSIIDTNIFEQYYYSSRNKIKKLERGKKFIFYNNNAIDSSGLRISNHTLLYNNKLYFTSVKGSSLYSLEKNGSISDNELSLNNLDQITNSLITKVKNSIYKVDIKEGNHKLVIDLNNYVDTSVALGGDYSRFEKYHSFSDKIILVKARCNIGCWKNEIYLFDISNKLLNKIDWISANESLQGVECDISLITDKNVLCNIIKSQTDIKNGEWILDNNLNPISKTLSKHQITSDLYNANQKEFYNFPKIAGCNYQKNSLYNYFLNVILDQNQSAIVPYKFIPQLEIAMYKAYNDTILSKEEIQDFGKYELGILRNSLFAKHNYNFNSEFYQAYFNLFAFYNHPEKRITRTKNVDSLLTDSDKKNIDLIRDLESNLEE